LTSRHSADSLEKLAGALVDAQLDLNPHQVDAALFAFHSPLSKGALLADEVGLGKTISDCPPKLADQTVQAQQVVLREISQRNAEFFEAEINKLETWADDRKITLEREIKEYDRRIKEARRYALAAITLEEKLVAQKEVKQLEKERTVRRRSLSGRQVNIGPAEANANNFGSIHCKNRHNQEKVQLLPRS